MRKAQLLNIVTITLFVGMFYACNDGGTDPENRGEAPQIPAFVETITVDINYFENNSPNVEPNIARASTDNFYTAKGYATYSTTFYLAPLAITGSMAQLLALMPPKFEDGKWVWTYTLSAEDVSTSYKLTAEKKGSGGYNWSLYVNAQGPEVNIKNALMISGSTSAEGKTGSWDFYDYVQEASSPFVTSNYTIESDDKKTISAEYFDYDGEGNNATFNHTQNADVFEIIYNDTQGENYTIHWNTTSMTGFYIDNDNVKHCWDSSFQDVEC